MHLFRLRYCGIVCVRYDVYLWNKCQIIFEWALCSLCVWCQCGAYFGIWSEMFVCFGGLMAIDAGNWIRLRFRCGTHSTRCLIVSIRRLFGLFGFSLFYLYGALIEFDTLSGSQWSRVWKCASWRRTPTEQQNRRDCQSRNSVASAELYIVSPTCNCSPKWRCVMFQKSS